MKGAVALLADGRVLMKSAIYTIKSFYSLLKLSLLSYFVMGEKALKKENQKLRAEVQKLSDELKNLQESFNSISNGGQASNTGQVNNAESEASASIQFLSD